MTACVAVELGPFSCLLPKTLSQVLIFSARSRVSINADHNMFRTLGRSSVLRCNIL